MRFKFNIEQDVEEIAEILNEKHLELLKLLFPNDWKRLEYIKSEITKEPVLMVVIHFKWKVFRRYRAYQINFNIFVSHLSFSVKTDKELRKILTEGFDNFKFKEYLKELGINTEFPKIRQRKSKTINGQQHSNTKGSNGFGRRPRSRGRKLHEGKIKLSRKKKNKKKKK